MNQEETLKLLAVMCSAYPSFEVTDERIILWEEMMEEVPFDLAIEKLRKIMKTPREFAPSIGMIYEAYEDQKKREREEHDEYLRLHGSAEPMKQLGVGD